MAAELPDWPEETIEDEHWLYRRLPPIFVKPDGTISDKLFMRNSEANRNKREPDPDISVDWDRYATPEQSLILAGRPTHGICGLQAMFPRALDLTATHTPDRGLVTARMPRSEGTRGHAPSSGAFYWPRRPRSTS